MRKLNSMKDGLIIALTVLLIDLVTKYLAYVYLLDHSRHITVTKFFNLVEAWNKGVSFSMFANSGANTAIVLSYLSVTIIFALIFWLKNENKILSIIGLGMVIGGAVGNLLNRLYNGAVFDFLDFHINTSHWPAFNFADSAIVIGSLMVIISNVNLCKHTK